MANESESGPLHKVGDWEGGRGRERGGGRGREGEGGRGREGGRERGGKGGHTLYVYGSNSTQ